MESSRAFRKPLTQVSPRGRIYGFALHLLPPPRGAASYTLPPPPPASSPRSSKKNPNPSTPNRHAGREERTTSHRARPNRRSCFPEEKNMSRHPSTKWAQRSDKVFLTIELPDARDVKLNLKPEGQFIFSAKGPADDTPYELDLELFDAVNVEESKAAVAARSICYLIKKAESKWWPRLLKKEGKPPVFLKVDWDKWQDEDDEDIGLGDFGDMDFSKLGMGGPDDDLEDDDEDDTADSANKEGSGEQEAAGEAKP
uniref:Co-chaperone protein p23 n=1 Tax=Oryza glumipatula TaxID=40148 RepID=A0A0D9Z855_9ORYZ